MKISQELYDTLKVLSHSMLDERGREMPNPLPLNVDVTPRPPTLQEQIQRLMRYELSKQARMQERETFDEADDFDVQDEFDMDEPLSQYSLMREEFNIKPREDEVPKKVKGEEGGKNDGTDDSGNTKGDLPDSKTVTDKSG